jgi:CheY-like chemotaxis protein
MKDATTHIRRTLCWQFLCAYFLLTCFLALGLYIGWIWQFQSSADFELRQHLQPCLDIQTAKRLLGLAFPIIFVSTAILHHVFVSTALKRLTATMGPDQLHGIIAPASASLPDETRRILSDLHDFQAERIEPQTHLEDAPNDLKQEVTERFSSPSHKLDTARQLLDRPLGTASTCEPTPWPPAGQTPSGAVLHILLVDDNRVNQQVALVMLKKWGHRIDLAGNGLEALEAVQRQDYDLVLMDIQMPEMDGVTATRQIRQLDSRCASVPIVAITANAVPGDRERFLAAGMNDYLAKPIDRDTFRRIVHRYEPRDGTAPTETPGEKTETEAPLLGNDVLSYLLDELSGEVVTELIDEYMTHSANLLSQALVASEEQDAKTIEYAVHTLKGMSGSLGALRMVDICQHILEMCRHQEADHIEPQLNVLSGTTQETQRALKAWRSACETG